MMDDTYPAADRQSCGYCIRFLRWVSESGVANEIGPEAFAMLAAVVLTEDALHYSRPPTFFNSQLLERCGIRSVPALIRTRTRVTEAGLLVYLPGAKRRPGTYFVSGFGNDSLLKAEGIRNETETKAKSFVTPPNPIPNTPTQKKARARSRKDNPEESPEFQVWYPTYPRKVARGRAAKAYQLAISRISTKQNCSAEVAARWLLERTEEFAESVAGNEEKFIPYPATWLNDARYDDQPDESEESIYADLSQHARSATHDSQN